MLQWLLDGLLPADPIFSCSNTIRGKEAWGTWRPPPPSVRCVCVCPLSSSLALEPITPESCWVFLERLLQRLGRDARTQLLALVLYTSRQTQSSHPPMSSTCGKYLKDKDCVCSFENSPSDGALSKATRTSTPNNS